MILSIQNCRTAYDIQEQLAVQSQNKMKEETSILQAFSKVIVEQWLRFDLINSKYRQLQNKQKEAIVYLPRATEAVLSNNQQEQLEEKDFYVQELEQENNQQTKKNVFEYYLSEEGENIQRQFPQLTPSEIRAKAAVNFKLLTPSQKLYFFRKYLKENRYQIHNQQIDNSQRKNKINSFNHRSDNGGIFKNNFYDPFCLSETQAPSLFNNPPDNHWKQQQQQKMLWQLPSRDQFLQMGNDILNEENINGLRIPSANSIPIFDRQQSKSKNQNLKPFISKQTQKTGQKGEQAKDKPDYQTLKSLFKRLQNTV